MAPKTPLLGDQLKQLGVSKENSPWEAATGRPYRPVGMIVASHGEIKTGRTITKAIDDAIGRRLRGPQPLEALDGSRRGSAEAR